MTDDGPLSQLEPPLRELIERLPREPGVYLLKDRAGKVVYVGKANNLHARVRSYFTRSGDTRGFVSSLSRVLGDVETLVTRNDKEALLLENTLIKQHRPRFNVKLRDDKSFLVLRLDTRKPFPRLEVTRRIDEDGARYFGPYHSASSCRETLRLVNRHFQLRTCTDKVMKGRSRPCLQYQIGRCPAPCVFEVDTAQYARQVEDVSLFLRGREDELIESIEQRMQTAAARLDFEHAARMRDQIEAVRRTLKRQEVVGSELLDQDVFAYHREGDAVDLVVLNLRAGKLVGRRPYSYTGQEFPDEELLSSFINQYYDTGESVPAQVLLPLALEDMAVKEDWLSERAGRKVAVLVPKRGKKRQLVDLAQRNARSNFASRRERHADTERSLGKLQQRLKLTRPPRHIECYDISSLMGQQVVGSMVVLRDGQPDPSSYRHFKVEVGRDDFAAMYEVLARRLRRAREGHRGWDLPDLIVVDGGKGQLSVALAALRDAALPSQIESPDMVALAKERAGEDAQGHDRPDRVFVPHVKDPVRLRPNTAELFLLSRIRDEAHRFAITHHKQLRRRKAFRSALDDIPGIGAKRKRELLRTLGSLKRIKEAKLEELTAVPSMSLKAAEAVTQYFASAAPAPTETPSATTTESEASEPRKGD